MNNNNMKIREEVLRNGLRYYQVAAAMGISENTFFRWLRSDLPPEKEGRVLQAIDELVRERKGAGHGV